MTDQSSAVAWRALTLIPGVGATRGISCVTDALAIHSGRAMSDTAQSVRPLESCVGWLASPGCA